MFRTPQACATLTTSFVSSMFFSSGKRDASNPSEALSDGPQQLTPAQFRELVEQLREIAAVFGKKIV